MQQFQSLKRLLFFYVLTLLIMLSLYYAMIFFELKADSQQYSLNTFNALQHEFIEHNNLTDPEIKKILDKPFLQNISYQLTFMLPSGQTYLYHHTHPDEREITTVTSPNPVSPFANNSNSTYTFNNTTLTGTMELESGHQFYIILHHPLSQVNWLSYRYWLPLMTAIILFIIALLYMLKRRANWEQVLLYTDNLNTAAKETYTPPPFINTKTTAEFSRLGHALSRIGYQLLNNHRCIKTLSHRLERLVNHAPLPMLMIMRHGQISFFNQRFEQIFATSFQSDANYQLTDFVTSNDESSQRLLQKVSTQRVSSTLLVYGIENKQAYQLHITPWFGEHGQIHGFTVLLNSVNKLVNQTEHLQQQNKQLQRQLSECGQLRSLISHELRPHLDSIIGILGRINPDTLSLKQHELLTTLTQSSHSMLTTINDRLAMLKPEASNTHIVNKPVDIFQVGQQVSQSMVENTRRQGLELLYIFAPDCPRYIDTDSKHLRQILLNLLDNAIKSTSSGYLALIIEPVSLERRLQAQKQDNSVFSDHHIDANSMPHWIRFSVQDTGVGIAPATRHELFTEVNPANAQTGQQSDSTRLGLTVSNGFAALLGGCIELDSIVNEGSTFSLYLPCRRPNYQPVYHFNTNLTHIHLIAVVNQPLCASNLQRLCQYLSIPASIYTAIEMTTKELLTEQPTQNEQALTPILLLDYEYYETSTMPVYDYSKDNDNKPVDEQVDHTEAEANAKAAATESQQTLGSLLNNPSLPKILFSMKSERGIPSTLLDQFDSFLSKPLDSTLLLSELMRLTLPVMRPPVQEASVKEDSDKRVTAVNNAVDETLVPLILVVEDSLSNQKITCKLLSKLGYRSVVAENGQQALDRLQAQRQDISLVLMDCRMPVMDGLQATQAIRAQGDDIPIVALTANDTEKDRDACIAVGMNEFLSKPISKDKLQAVLQTVLQSIIKD